MARRRMLDPTLWDDPDLAQLTPVERLLFIGLVSLADDYGHVSGNAPLLRKLIFGYDDFTVAQVLEMRNNIISACRNVELYQSQGQDFIWLKTWERHQDLRFRAKGQCPCHACGCYHTAQDYQACQDLVIAPSLATPDDCESLRSPCVSLAQPLRPDYVTSCRDTLSNDISTHVAPSGAECVTEPSKKQRRSRTETPEGFDTFWEAYPRKKARAVALLAYAKVLKSGVKPETLRAGAENYSQECQLAGREWQYICFPATFLNQRRFEDYQGPPDPADFMPKAGAAKVWPQAIKPKRAIDNSEMAGDKDFYVRMAKDRTRGASDEEDIGTGPRP